MKKIIFVAALCFLSIVGYAQKFKLTSGDLDFLKTEQAIIIKFTYDDVRVGKMTEEEYIAKKLGDANAKKPGSGDAWLESWNADRPTRFEPKFIELFDKYMGEAGKVVSGKEGKYAMTINTTFVEPGYNIGISRKNASVDATATFTEKETGNVVALVSIEDSSANDFMGTDFDVAYRIQESYAKAGRELAKFLIKKTK